MQRLLRGISCIDCLKPQYHLFSSLLTPCYGLYIGHSVTCSSHCGVRPVSFCHWKSNPSLEINSILFPLLQIQCRTSLDWSEYLKNVGQLVERDVLTPFAIVDVFVIWVWHDYTDRTHHSFHCNKQGSLQL